MLDEIHSTAVCGPQKLRWRRSRQLQEASASCSEARPKAHCRARSCSHARRKAVRIVLYWYGDTDRCGAEVSDSLYLQAAVGQHSVRARPGAATAGARPDLYSCQLRVGVQ